LCTKELTPQRDITHGKEVVIHTLHIGIDKFGGILVKRWGPTKFNTQIFVNLH
jgi:hypothetical protein